MSYRKRQLHHHTWRRRGREDARFPITANDLKPPECAALPLTIVIVGSGTINGGSSNALILGSAGVDTIRGQGGNDCILGGGGNDDIRGGNGTEVLIGGPGAPTTPPEDLTSGYTVTNISYTLNTADPRRIASVAFTIVPSTSAARMAIVRAKLVSASTSYSSCANVPAGSKWWSCPIGGVTIAAADLLTVDVNEAPAAPKYLLGLPLIRR